MCLDDLYRPLLPDKDLFFYPFSMSGTSMVDRLTALAQNEFDIVNREDRLSRDQYLS